MHNSAVATKELQCYNPLDVPAIPAAVVTQVRLTAWQLGATPTLTASQHHRMHYQMVTGQPPARALTRAIPAMAAATRAILAILLLHAITMGGYITMQDPDASAPQTLETHVGVSGLLPGLLAGCHQQMLVVQVLFRWPC